MRYTRARVTTPLLAREAVRRETLIGVALPALALLGSIVFAGYWDPYEVNVADLGRRAAVNELGASWLALGDADNTRPTLGDIGHGELPVMMMAFAFRLFGLAPWVARLPMALAGVAAIAALWAWLARAVAPRAATLATLALATTPLFAIQARTALGDVVPMAALVCAFAGLSTLAFERKRLSRPARACWASVAVTGLAAGFASRGAATGVAVPLVSVGFVGVFLAPRTRGLRSIAFEALALVAGVAVTTRAFWFDAGTSRLDRWSGTWSVVGQRYPTFDATAQVLGYALLPWSAFLPFALGRLASPPAASEPDSAHRTAYQSPLRSVLLVGAGLAFAAHAWSAPRIGAVPFSGVGLLAAIAGVAAYDFLRGEAPSRAVAVACALVMMVLALDLVRVPERGLAPFGVSLAEFPDSFRRPAELWVRGAAFACVTAAAFAFLAPAAATASSDRLGWWGVDDALAMVRSLDGLWGGNASFAATMLEAALVGAGALVFVGTRAGVAFADPSKLGAPVASVLLNAWWVVPTLLFGSIFVVAALRAFVANLVARWRAGRAALLLAGLLAAGGLLTYGYYPALASQLSPRGVFTTYLEKKRPGETIGLLGVAGRSAAYFGVADAHAFLDADEALGWLLNAGQGRRWLAARANDVPRLNALYRAAAAEPRSPNEVTSDHNLPVLDARTSHVVLMSNRLERGETSANPFASSVGATPVVAPHAVAANFGDQIEALGWGLYDGDDRVLAEAPLVVGRRYTLRVFFRVLASSPVEWQVFLHIGRQRSSLQRRPHAGVPDLPLAPGRHRHRALRRRARTELRRRRVHALFRVFPWRIEAAGDHGRHAGRPRRGRRPSGALRGRAISSAWGCTRPSNATSPRRVTLPSEPPADDPSPPSSSSSDGPESEGNRRSADRFEVTWSVDCEASDTFLYASITNISAFGIFVHTMQPLMIGTKLQLRFAPPGTQRPFALAGQVQWVNPVRALGDNPNPGMGIRFLDLSHDDRERLVDVIRTIAYVRDASSLQRLSQRSGGRRRASKF